MAHEKRTVKPIIFINNSPKVCAGVERYTTVLSKHLLNQGYETHVLLNKAGPFCEILDSAAVPYSVFPPHAILQAIKKKSPAIIHWHCSRLTRFRLGNLHIPVIERLNMTRHTNEWYATRFKPYDIWSQTWFTHFIVVSGTLRDQFIARGYPANKLTTIHNGCDIVDTAPRRPIGNPFKLGFIGRFVQQKGLDVLQESLQHVSKPIHLSIAGAGPLEDKIKLTIPKNNQRHDIHFVGYQPDAKQFLKKIDCLIYPSRYEPFSNTILESMSVGTPVIASRVGGNTEAIEHEKSGLLFENENPQALANAIMRMKTDKELRDRCILGGFEQLKKFSVENMVQGHLDLYEKLLREKR